MTHLPQLFSETGITAHAASANVAVARGASRNTPLSAPAGISGSFSANFNRSANDCSRPNGPTTLGPRRICTAAHTLRSISSRNAIRINKPNTTAALSTATTSSHHSHDSHCGSGSSPRSHCIVVIAAPIPSILAPHSAARRPAVPLAIDFNALNSAMIADERAIGLVK